MEKKSAEIFKKRKEIIWIVVFSFPLEDFWDIKNVFVLNMFALLSQTKLLFFYLNTLQKKKEVISLWNAVII